MRDLVSTAWACVEQMFLQGRSTGVLVTVLAVFAGSLFTFCCQKSAWSWNRKYTLTLPGYFLCVVAGCAAFVSVMVFAGAGYIKESAVEIIDAWNQYTLSDKRWQDEVFRSTKQSVKELRDSAGNPIEDYSNFDPDRRRYDDPDSTYIPLNSPEAREKCAFSYASETVQSFGRAHPILGRLLFADQDKSAALILRDVQEYFKVNQGGIYPADQGFKLGVRQIKRELEEGTDRLIRLARAAIFATFLAIEIICFGVISIMAYGALRLERKLIRS